MYGRGRGRRDDNSGGSSNWRSSGPPQKESKLDDWHTPSHVDRQPSTRPQTNTDEWDNWTCTSDQQANTGQSNAASARSTEAKMEETNWDDWGSNCQLSQSQHSGTQSHRHETDMPNERKASYSWSNNSSGGQYPDNHLSTVGGGHSDSHRRDRQLPAGCILVIRVPNGTVGRVIGKGGAKINELQDQTGARIRVLRDNDNGVDTGVQIFGSAEQQKQAEQLIKELTENTNPYPGSRFSTMQSMNSASSRPLDNAEEDMATIDWGAVIKNSIEATKKRWANSPPICKNFYVEDPEVATMRREEIEEFRLTHNKIMVSHYKTDDDRPIPNPVMKFDQAFGHFPELLAAVKNQKFSEPSPIQTQAWPILLKGHDLIGIAQTGTGKTLAFLLPALIHIEGQPIPRDQRDGPTVLIMAPTRELAQQIEREVAKFPYKGIKCVCVYGGGDRREQIGKVAKGVEIVVATPGRLYDLMSAGALKTCSVSYVVLDEADRMLDQGFEPEIKKILIDVRPDKQMIMTSATWPEGIRRIANDYMDNPLQVCVGTMDLAAVHSVSQHVEIMAEEDKRQRLMDFIQSLGPDDKAIVFVGRKIVADQVASELSLVGIACQCIHGDRDQMDREQALADLRTGDVKLLIATDVASRGIDIKDITHILNYDFPRHAEEYVHRVGKLGVLHQISRLKSRKVLNITYILSCVGRTGRAGATGIAISFMTREDWSKAEDLIKILREAGQEIPAELISMAERFGAWKERKDEERRRNQIDAGGRGSSGRGGASGRGCFKCGEEGHMSRECPSGGGRGGGGRSGGRGRGGSRRGFDDFF